MNLFFFLNFFIRKKYILWCEIKAERRFNNLIFRPWPTNPTIDVDHKNKVLGFINLSLLNNAISFKYRKRRIGGRILSYDDGYDDNDHFTFGFELEMDSPILVLLKAFDDGIIPFELKGDFQ